MTQNMDILIVEPGKAPRPAVIPNTLESVETVLGGAVQVGCFLPQRVLLFSREDTTGLAPNRCLPGKDGYISGTFLLCGIPEEGCLLDSLTARQQKEFQDIFVRPGEFMMVGSTAYADPDDVADAVYSLWDTLSDGDTVVLTKWGGNQEENA
ncbi:DUF3846 domain-containing protein [Otoolea muris]|uniref:DUF3846 domain-containing protein n=1 Tax=Otoolea muris TaxID=2941515 RepID=UPI00203DD068|nr:DUF3846 domain-containing protein [Otoolea muris]